MKRNKKLLLYFLALNTIISSYLGAETTVPAKYDKMYNNMAKNIEKGKSNKENYKLIEKILNKRNKELKDLYKQNDYIVKPEYLEWQVFFSGFYNERNRGDNTFENAQYHSDPDFEQQGYYDINGKYVVTDQGRGKPYAKPQEPREINLGVSIPIKGMTREALNLALTPTEAVDISPAMLNVVAPAPIFDKAINIHEFSIAIPTVTPPDIEPVNIVNLGFSTTPNKNEHFVIDNGSIVAGTTASDTKYPNAIISQQEMIDGTFTVADNGGTYTADISGVKLTGISGTGTRTTQNAGNEINYTWGAQNNLYVIKMTGRHLININNVNMEYTGNSNSNYRSLFFTDSHNSEGGNSIGHQWILDNKTKVTLKGQKIVLFSVQSHGTSGSSGMTNNGTINLDNSLANSGNRIVFTTINDEIAGNVGRDFYIVNSSTGKITLSGTNDLLANFDTPGTVAGTGVRFENYGEITLNGDSSKGIVVKPLKPTSKTTAGDTKIILSSPITLNGDNSIGIILNRQINLGLSTLNFNIGTAVNDPTSTGNSGANDPGLVEKAIGLYYNITAPETLASSTLTNYNINFGDYAKDSTLFRIEKGNLILDNTNVSTINIGGASGNFGFIVTGNNSNLEIRPDIALGTSLKGVNNSTAVYAELGGTVKLGGDISVYGENSHGIYAKSAGTTVSNTTGTSVDVITNGNKSASIYSSGATISFTNGGDYKALGEESLVVYADNGTINLTGSGQTYEVGKNGVLFDADNGGIINVTNTSGNLSLKVGEGSMFSVIGSGGGKINFTGGAGTFKVTLDSDATGFKYTGTGANITAATLASALETNYTGLSNLDITLNAGSRLFVLENYGTMKLSDIDTVSSVSSEGGIFKSVSGTGSNAYLWKGILELDSIFGTARTVDLDNSEDFYNKVEKSVSGVLVNSGVSVNGTLAGQIGFADINPYTTIYVKMTNNGTINLTGADSLGIYTDNGEITNNSVLNVTGQNGLGLFGENGTEIVNSSGGTITVGDKGIGIYGISYKDPSTPQAYGNVDAGNIDITNSGTIKANAGTGAIGIYANNNKIGGTIDDSKINLSTGTINVSASNGGIGVYVNKGTVTDAGSTITVGKNGIGIYAKDSRLNLNNTRIDLNGDNSLGLYLDGTTSLDGTGGTINIAGRNIVLFNIASSGSFSNNFTVGTVAAGSSYSLVNIVSRGFTYTGVTNLGSNGTFVSGQGSGVFLNGSTITSSLGSTGVAAIALDGQYAGTVTGMTPDIDGENDGTITLGDSSVGIYGKNGTRLSNLKTINVGDASAGIMTSGADSKAINKGTITLGAGSQGIYMKDGKIMQNKGLIKSSGAGTVGMYANNVSDPIVNEGTIQLTGEKSIGIYKIGAGVIIDNIGKIEVGDSSNPADPSIGIFSDNSGDVINNTGTITSGKNSIGIYSAGGTVNQNGTLNIGNTGVGIYSTNGTVNIGSTAVFNFGTNGAVGVYATNSNVKNAGTMNIGSKNYGFILTGGTFINSSGANVTLGSDSVFVYKSGAGTVTNSAGTILTMTGSDNIGYYTVNGATVINDGTITGTAGNNNIGIYNTNGSITNSGRVSVGDSDLEYVLDATGAPTTEVDIANSKYAVGLYGENSTIVNTATGNVTVGAGGIGIATKGGTGTNEGSIEGTGNNVRGMYTESGTIINKGTISLTGNDAIGMAGNKDSHVINEAGAVITVTGDRVIGIYATSNTTVTNAGTIIVKGQGTGQGIVLSQGSTLINSSSGTIQIDDAAPLQSFSVEAGNSYQTPTIINSGVIKVSEKFETNGIDVVIKVDPKTVKAPTASEISGVGYDPIAAGASYLISNSVHIEAPAFNITAPLKVTGNFAEGTNVKKYKLEDVIKPGSGYGINLGKVPVVSKSLTWRATPVLNAAGNVDIWMEKIPYDDFTNGLWYADFGRALDDKYENAQGDAMKIYDKLDIIEKERDFRHIMAGLAGEVYANINQREDDIAKTFENSLDFIENSTNNTKENVKVNIIAGKGKSSEDTDGVVGYDYSTAGVLGLREVERTYRHTFGYSLGYLHTGFEFNDGNESEEQVDTIQLGVHSKYNMNDWKLRNDLTGRVSFHNVDRNIDWTGSNGRSEMNGTYETYSITSDNILGREFGLGKHTSVTPYGAFRAMYVIRPTFSETGLEALEVEGNDAWSVKPRAGIELKAALPLGPRTAWQLKGTLDFAYEYELADLNEREKARLIAVEDGYHDLSKPEDEKGTFRTRASLGAEVEDRYGIFLTGEYGIGNSDQDDYRAGVTLKAVF